MYSTSVRFDLVKSPEMTLCGWVGYKPSIKKIISVCCTQYCVVCYTVLSCVTQYIELCVAHNTMLCVLHGVLSCVSHTVLSYVSHRVLSCVSHRVLSCVSHRVLSCVLRRVLSCVYRVHVLHRVLGCVLQSADCYRVCVPSCHVCNRLLSYAAASEASLPTAEALLNNEIQWLKKVRVRQCSVMLWVSLSMKVKCEIGEGSNARSTKVKCFHES